MGTPMRLSPTIAALFAGGPAVRRLRRCTVIAASLLRTPATVLPPVLSVATVALAPALAAVEDVRDRLAVGAT